MKYFDYNSKKQSKAIAIEQDNRIFYSIVEVSDKYGTNTWALKTLEHASDKTTETYEYPFKLYDLSDFNTEKDKTILKELFYCIWQTDNGITNYIEFNEHGICEQNESLTKTDFDDFIKRYPEFNSTLIQEDEDSIGVTISFVTKITRDIFTL